MFRRAIRRGRLAHAYLFLGPDGIGKKLFAKFLAQGLLCEQNPYEQLQPCGECSCCKRVFAGTHPDLYIIGRLAGKSELTIDVFLGPMERRGQEGLCHELSLRPMVGDRKIAIIDDADLMNDESGNALLKTLEEPPPNSLLIVLSSNVDALLPTIRSRCQLVRFSPLSQEIISGLLVNLEMVADQQEAQSIATLSDGSLTTASQLLDPALRHIRDALYSELSAESFNPLAAAATVVEAIEQIGGPSNEQRQNAEWVVRFCIEFYRQALLQLSGGVATFANNAVNVFCARYSSESPDDIESIGGLLQRCETAGQQLSWKLGIPLCFQGLFNDLRKLTGSKAAPS